MSSLIDRGTQIRLLRVAVEWICRIEFMGKAQAVGWLVYLFALRAICASRPQLDDDPGEGSGGSWAGSPGRPLVLAGPSSTVMRQERLLQRAADALGQAQVRGLVTTGPAVDPVAISAPDNVTVTRWARHADVLPHCSAVITHGGHGTVMKALIAGVPLIVVPLGRDQPDNAARVVHAGAGIRLRKNATVSALQAAISQVIKDPPVPHRRTAHGSPAGCRTRRQPRCRRTRAGSRRPRISHGSSETHRQQLAPAPCSRPLEAAPL